MVQLPAVPESATREAVVQTPLDDYELLDFGAGRKLERWGAYVVERPDRLARGRPRLERWNADWVYVARVGRAGHWQPAAPDLNPAWSLLIQGERVECRLSPGGRVGLHGRDILCGRWLRERIAGCYDLDDIRVLSLFAGNGYLAAQAVRAGAAVTCVDADADMLALAREQAGSQQVQYIQENVMDYVEELLRRQERFDLIVLPAPALGHGPRGQLWDREVDLPRLMAYLPRLVTAQCLGIWVSTDSGANTWKGESLGQILHDALPGRTIEPLRLGVRCVDGRVLPAGVAARWFDDSDYLQSGNQSLTAAQLEERLDVHMLSAGAAEEACRALAECPRAQQDFVLHWVAVAARTSAGIAFNFVTYVPAALRLMDEAGIEAWLLQCMDIYDTRGLHPAVAAFKDVEGFARDFKARQTGLAFEDVVNVLEPFVHGLNGRKLRLEAGPQAYTDTETLYLPPTLSRFAGKARNYQLYKAILVHQWAQTWFGTWRLDQQQALAGYDDATRALALFHALETLRLDACIEREFAGLGRELRELRELVGTPVPAEWHEVATRLQAPGASAQTTLDWVERLYGCELPAPPPYAGVLLPEAVTRVRALRIEKDRQRFRILLARTLEEQQRKQAAQETTEPEEQDAAARGPAGLQLKVTPAEESPSGVRFEFDVDGRPVAPPEDLKGTMASIWQDLGEIPPDYLVAAGDGAYHAGDAGLEDNRSADVWKGTYHEEGAFLYNEWDYERQHYRKNWSVLREMEVHPSHDGFVAETLQKYRGLTGELRRTFEALRGEDKLLKKQPYGDDVDIDALVEAYADTKNGLEMTDRLFTKLHKLERNIAVMFMVDMSGSTKGWINDAERESLVLLCESLELLGDRYAIYGFSGMTRKRCEVYRVKGFDEPYDREVQARISGIRPKDYTRMGVTIRHLSKLLNAVEARTKLLITLSDGKPDDYDGYRGAYGIEDTRQALIEARRDGIHPFCITIDTEARDYLPHMYGAANYVVIDEVRKLPMKVSDIYRRLTS